MVSLVREWVLFILSFILSMDSRKAVLSAPRALDMVLLGDDLQGGSNQGVKALVFRHSPLVHTSPAYLSSD